VPPKNEFDTGKAAVMAYTNLNFDSELKEGPPEGVQFNTNWRLSPKTRNSMMVHSGDDI
jgi:hypothetical protein